MGASMTMGPSGSSTEPATASSTDPATTDDTTTDTPTTSVDDTTTAADSSTGGGETAGETKPGFCDVWEISYDLTGSQFEISGTPFGAGDQVNTVQAPFGDDSNIGPGTFVLYFEDVGGEPGGLATMVSYDMVLDFVVDGTVTVTTEITGEAGPEECGITQGALAGDTVAWAPPQIVGYESVGFVQCEGALCGAGGLPNGEPVDMSGTTDQPISDFVFSDDFTGFTMERVVTDMTENSTNSWSYVGTETARRSLSVPDCVCG